MIWMKERCQGESHMVPQNDDIMHEIKEECICGPHWMETDQEPVYMHRALRTEKEQP